MEEIKRSNLDNKIAELPEDVRASFFASVTAERIYNALFNVRINSTDPEEEINEVLTFFYPEPRVISNINQRELEEVGIAICSVPLNYYECLELLQKKLMKD